MDVEMDCKSVEKGMNVSSLKSIWRLKHGFHGTRTNCFFCEYADEYYPFIGFIRTNCSHCPGRLISRSFNCCSRLYNYNGNPKKFYQKLLQLDAKRKEFKNGKQKNNVVVAHK
jgi:hypothetical protein